MGSEFVEELRRRVVEARAAGEACSDAEALLEVTASLRDSALIARCAWCGSYRVGERWLHESQMPPAATTSRGPANVSHTICSSCVEQLRATGLSA